MPARVAHPESIVETDWVAQHLDDPSVRLVEVDVDLGSYAEGHIPDAVEWDWTSHLNDPVQRDILSREQMRRLLGECGITPSTSVVLYGDNNNWFATYAFWQLKMYGHRRARIMNGGRQKWIDEGRPMTTEPPQIERRRKYQVGNPDTTLRALRGYVLDVATTRNNVGLVDVRSPAEYRGEVLAPPNLPQEGAQRGGHIPGAANIPWGTAVNEADGTFKSVEELREIYGSRRITHDREIITYCRIGERSSHTWFVLTQILGYEKVRNYDGSWTEYGSIVGAPIER